jgi:ABC-2 type transport system permease protein
MRNYLIKHLGLLKRFFIISFRRAIEYRISFYFNMVNQFLKFGIWIVFWEIILNQVGVLKGWDLPMMVMLVGFYFFQEGLWIIFWRNWNYSDDIINGYMTVFLVRPLNPYLALIWKHMDVMRLGELFLGMGLVIFSLFYYGIQTTLLKLTLGFIICTLGTFLILNSFAIINALSFWWGRISAIRNIFVAFFVTEKVPITIFPATIKFMFTFMLPIIFIATYPVLAVVEFTVAESLNIILIESMVAVIWFFIFSLIWKRGIRRFEAYGG